MRRAGIAVSDVVIGVAGVVLILAAIAPTLRARSFDGLVEDARADVETLSAASVRYFTERSAWPATAEPGVIPPEVAGAFSGSSTLDRGDYTVQWQVLQMVESRDVEPGSIALPGDVDATPDSVSAPRRDVSIDYGSVLVRSSDDELLAALLEHYGPRDAFVRDSTFLLVVGVGSGS